MTEQRAGVFDDDLSDFKPTRPIPAEKLRSLAEQAGFPSRDPKPAVVETPAPMATAAVTKEQRRYRTGRNRQLNLKVRAEDAETFYAIADAKGWVLGETFTHAIAALRRELEASVDQE